MKHQKLPKRAGKSTSQSLRESVTSEVSDCTRGDGASLRHFGPVAAESICDFTSQRPSQLTSAPGSNLTSWRPHQSVFNLSLQESGTAPPRSPTGWQQHPLTIFRQNKKQTPQSNTTAPADHGCVHNEKMTARMIKHKRTGNKNSIHTQPTKNQTTK